MVYTCQICGAWFPKDELKRSLESNAKTIYCPYCGNHNELDQIKTSHISKGYDSLEYGDFYTASMEFGEALKKSNKSASERSSKSLDAYLGRALAQYSVQVIYDEDIADAKSEPEINCYICNDSYIEDSYDYQTALEIASAISDPDLRNMSVRRVTEFAKKIDGIKRVYDRKKANNESYQLFIACEDEIGDILEENRRDAEAGQLIANKIRDKMPSGIKKVFILDGDGSRFDPEYEGSILYAIHHSTCMLVVVDNDAAARLMNLYSRYYWAMATDSGRLDEKHLGFVRYKNKVQIHLPEHKISDSVFELRDVGKYCEFVCAANKIFYKRPTDIDDIIGEGELPVEVEEPEEDVVDTTPTAPDTAAPVLEGRICRFGSYPQRRVTDEAIISHFSSEPKPTLQSDNGWQVMFRNKESKPYTWYKDKVIDGKKYRAVFFNRFREIFTIRPTDIPPSVQRMAKYTPMRIYVFAFEDIEWNILDVSRSCAVLVSSVGLDCREYNSAELCAEWEYSTMRTWLNEEFCSVAFTEDQQSYLWQNSEEERVTILDSELDFSSRHYRDRLNSYNISGSDYFRCIGGFCDRCVGNFWIKAPTDQPDKAPAVQPHRIGCIVPQCVDNTAVSVLPIIRVKIVNR